MTTAAIIDETPVSERICARCAHSRNGAGDLFQDHDRAYCAHPSVTSDTGDAVPCESQRFPARGSALLQQCGVDAILFESRQ